MRPVAVKICGLTRPEDAEIVSAAGAAACGLVFHEKSPRHVSLEQARAVAAACGPAAIRVGVFVDAPADAMARLVEGVPLDAVQLHGNEAPALMQVLQVPVVKAFRVGPAFDGAVAMKEWESAAGFLFDTFEEGKAGGTGATFAWARLDGLPRERLVLSGGLSPENVVDAIRAVGPAAIDLSSRLETHAGRKSAMRVRDLVHRLADGGIELGRHYLGIPRTSA